jgi:hypothetical protein
VLTSKNQQPSLKLAKRRANSGEYGRNPWPIAGEYGRPISAYVAVAARAVPGTKSESVKNPCKQILQFGLHNIRDEKMKTSIKVPEDKAAYFVALSEWSWLIAELFCEYGAFRWVLEYFDWDKLPKLSEIEVVKLENHLCAVEAEVQYGRQMLNKLKPILLHGLARYGDEEDVCDECDEWWE